MFLRCLIAVIATAFPLLAAGAEPGAPPNQARIRVLSYNIRGLPWPLRIDGEAAFEHIGKALRERRERGEEPDIVLLQEAFSPSTKRLIALSGYPYVVKGPERSELTADERHRVRLAHRPVKLATGQRLSRKFANSGLYILSNHRIVKSKSEPYGAAACAGFDCLANKAILYARIAPPSLPFPLDIVNTHMNSDMAAKASERKKLAAFIDQTNKMKAFIEEIFSPRIPALIGGDFNASADLETMVTAEELRSPGALSTFAPRQTLRYPYLMNHIGAIDAGQYCLERPVACAVPAATPRDMVWLNALDRQIFRDAEDVRIRPVSVARTFAERPGGRVLSDHLGYEVEYLLSW